jgi:hypothetical protein
MNVKEITLNIVENLSRTTDNDLSITLSNATLLNSFTDGFIVFNKNKDTMVINLKF